MLTAGLVGEEHEGSPDEADDEVNAYEDEPGAFFGEMEHGMLNLEFLRVIGRLCLRVADFLAVKFRAGTEEADFVFDGGLVELGFDFDGE